jgi:cytochrome c553
MPGILKTVAVGVAAVVVLGAGGAGAYVHSQTAAFDESMEKVYAVPVPAVTRSTDPAVLARGKHVAESVAACAATQCHGADFGGGDAIDMGPVGLLTGPNVSEGGLGAAYSDGELVRLIKHGIKKDGRSLRFMPASDFCWLPDDDALAVVSYLRSMPPVDRPNGMMEVKTLGKVLDRKELFVMDVARRIDHEHPLQGMPPAPTPEYGRLLARLCSGCHGEHYSGGKIPGSPPSVPIPSNLTPDDTGLKSWDYADFARLLDTGLRKNGKKLDPFMPLGAVSKFDDVERHALWAYLKTLPPTPVGRR